MYSTNFKNICCSFAENKILKKTAAKMADMLRNKHFGKSLGGGGANAPLGLICYDKKLGRPRVNLIDFLC